MGGNSPHALKPAEFSFSSHPGIPVGRSERGSRSENKRERGNSTAANLRTTSMKPFLKTLGWYPPESGKKNGKGEKPEIGGSPGATILKICHAWEGARCSENGATRVLAFSAAPIGRGSERDSGKRKRPCYVAAQLL